MTCEHKLNVKYRFAVKQECILRERSTCINAVSPYPGCHGGPADANYIVGEQVERSELLDKNDRVIAASKMASAIRCAACRKTSSLGGLIPGVPNWDSIAPRKKRSVGSRRARGPARC